jgi:hypothetical protein
MLIPWFNFDRAVYHGGMNISFLVRRTFLCVPPLARQEDRQECLSHQDTGKNALSYGVS